MTADALERFTTEVEKLVLECMGHGGFRPNGSWAGFCDMGRRKLAALVRAGGVERTPDDQKTEGQAGDQAGRLADDSARAVSGVGITDETSQTKVAARGAVEPPAQEPTWPDPKKYRGMKPEDAAQWLEVIDLDGYRKSIKEARDYAIEALRGARPSPPSAEPKCRACDKGLAVVMVDEDGTYTHISKRPGVPSHAVDDAWWPCPKWTQASPPPATPQEDTQCQGTINGYVRCERESGHEGACGYATLPAAPHGADTPGQETK